MVNSDVIKKELKHIFIIIKTEELYTDCLKKDAF